jgi:hypothetical protein
MIVTKMLILVKKLEVGSANFRSIKANNCDRISVKTMDFFSGCAPVITFRSRLD